MKTKNKLYAVTLLILLLSAVFVSAVSADTLEPWEEEFLEEYGEYWMYEDYGNQWFEYFLYEGNDEERYNELSLMSQNLAAQNAVPSNSVLEPWEERFLLEYGEDWMYEDLENFDKSWIYLNYGVNWFEYYLDEGEDELYNTLLHMYEEQKAQNTVPFKTSDISVDGSSNLSVQNTSNTTVLDSTNTSILNITNTTTLNTTNTTIQNLTNPSILNTTNTSSLNVTEKPDQNETVTPNQNPENGIPIVPIIVGTVIAVILVTGVVVLVLRKRSVSEPVDTPTRVQEMTQTEERIDVSTEENAESVEIPTVISKPELMLATPKECYVAVLLHLANKHGIPHSESLTPRQLLEFGEPTAELTEFIKYYEQIRYAPKTGEEDIAKLAELAGKILKQ